MNKKSPKPGSGRPKNPKSFIEDPEVFPNLNEKNHCVIGVWTFRYNCISWAAGFDDREWWPYPDGKGYWPEHAPREFTIDAFMCVFIPMGYTRCRDGSLQKSFEKIVIYGLQDGDKTMPTHVARQLPNGRWTSKLGGGERIEHLAPDNLIGPKYGQPCVFMKRPLEIV